MNHRRPRKDSKLHQLPPAHRARVDKWLFDKGLSYQQVADACQAQFGLQITKSSVARYHQRQSVTALKTPARADTPPPADPENTLELAVAEFTKRGLDLAEYLQLEPDPTTMREFIHIMRFLIEARREKTDALRARLCQDKFERWAAVQCLQEIRRQARPPRAPREVLDFDNEIRIRAGELIAAEQTRQHHIFSVPTPGKTPGISPKTVAILRPQVSLSPQRGEGLRVRGGNDGAATKLVEPPVLPPALHSPSLPKQGSGSDGKDGIKNPTIATPGFALATPG